tara:strand:- start:24 stop:2168 length:2145 start_codon:yes stop_codon:yes gene_type:complete
MKNYILIDPTEIKDMIAEQFDPKAAEQATAPPKKKKKTKTTKGEEGEPAGEEKESDPKKKKQDKPDDEKSGDEKSGEEEKEKSWWEEAKETAAEISDDVYEAIPAPGLPGERTGDTALRYMNNFLEYGIGIGSEAVDEAARALWNGDFVDAYKALQPAVNDRAEAAIGMMLEGERGEEGWSASLTPAQKDLAEELALGSTQLLMMVWGLHVARKKALSDIIETGRIMKWSDAKVKSALDKFDKSNLFTRGMRGAQEVLSIFPGIANTKEMVDSQLKKAGYDPVGGTYDEVELDKKIKDFVGENVPMKGNIMEPIMRRARIAAIGSSVTPVAFIYEYAFKAVFAGEIDKVIASSVAEQDMSNYLDINPTEFNDLDLNKNSSTADFSKILDQKLRQFEAEYKKLQTGAGAKEIEANEVAKKIDMIKKMQERMQKRNYSLVERAARTAGIIAFETVKFVAKPLIKVCRFLVVDILFEKGVLETVLGIPNDKKISRQVVRDIYRSPIMQEGIQAARVGPSGKPRVGIERAKEIAKQAAKLKIEEESWWKKAWRKVKELGVLLTPGKKTKKAKGNLNEQEEDFIIGFPTEIYKQLEQYNKFVLKMVQEITAKDAEIDKDIQDALFDIADDQTEFLNAISAEMPEKIQDDINTLSFTDDPVQSPDMPLSVQEGKLRVSKEALINLIYEQFKANKRTYKVDKYELVDIIAEEAKKQINRKK